jgi:aspartate ammonia-lyase
MKTGRSIYDIVLKKGYLTKKQLDDVLLPENMIRPRYIPKKDRE